MFHVEVTIPKDLFDTKQFEKDAIDVLDWMVKETYKDYKATVGTWKHHVSFYIKQAHWEDAYRVLTSGIATTDLIFIGVDQGTRRHDIPARRKKTLKYQKHFRPKTVPKRIGSTAGGKYGPWRSPKKVTHPGTQPRRFTETIAANREPDFLKMTLKLLET